MLTRLHITSYVGLTFAALAAALWAQGNAILSWEFFKPFSIVVSIIVGVSTAFTKWAWAWRVFDGWYVNRPDLRGTWRVILKSDWVNPDTGARVPPIDGYLSVRQSLLSLTARLMTKESKSHSIAYSLEKEADGICRLAVVYRNEPNIELQGVRSEIHHGSFILEVVGTRRRELRGHYWTDRKTRGEMICSGQVKSLSDTFEEASETMGQEGQP